MILKQLSTLYQNKHTDKPNICSLGIKKTHKKRLVNMERENLESRGARIVVPFARVSGEFRNGFKIRAITKATRPLSSNTPIT